MQKIVPHLWFDTQAKEAAEFYVRVFGEKSKVGYINILHDTPSGDCDIVAFELWGQEFVAISAGSLFKFNPSISFHVKCGSIELVEAMWKKLAEGGKVLMELGEYPWSKRYAWTEDKYGVSWQIVPVAMDEMMKNGSEEQVKRVTGAFLKMKKFNIAELQKAYQ